MSLEFAELKTDAHLNVLLYGGPKTGKSVGAATAPGPILYLNCDRPNATRVARSMSSEEIREVKVHGLQTMIDVTNELIESPENWGSVVVDPIGELHRLVIEGLSGRALHPQIQEYGDTMTHLERFFRGLCDLPVNTVFVAHEITLEGDGELEKVPFTGTKNPALAAKLAAMTDVIAYTGVVAGENGAPPKYLAQLVPGAGRRGGSRFASLGPYRSVNIKEWAELVHAELSSEGKEQAA